MHKIHWKSGLTFELQPLKPATTPLKRTVPFRAPLTNYFQLPTETDAPGSVLSTDRNFLRNNISFIFIFK